MHNGFRAHDLSAPNGFLRSCTGTPNSAQSHQVAGSAPSPARFDGSRINDSIDRIDGRSGEAAEPVEPTDDTDPTESIEED